MNEGRTVFAQLMEHAPQHQFRHCVERYQGNARVRRFRCWDKSEDQDLIAISTYVLVDIQ